MFIEQIIQLVIQLFFLFTPFFALSVFLSLSEGLTHKEVFGFVFRTTIAITITCYTLIFGGQTIFNIFGITIDAFRIGAGCILFLNGIDLVRGKAIASKSTNSDEDPAVVPLAIPIIVGPATIGALLVMGAEFKTVQTMMPLIIALPIAIILLAALLLSAPFIIRLIGKKGVIIFSRLTGLILAAMAGGMMFTGLQHYLREPIQTAVENALKPESAITQTVDTTTSETAPNLN